MDYSSNMQAFLDDFDIINIYISKNFYQGKSDFFYINNADCYHYDCNVNDIEETRDYIKYQVKLKDEYDFSKEYYLFNSLGSKCTIQVRFVVKNPKFDELFYYDKDDLGAKYFKNYTDFNLWAPSATKVILEVETNNKSSYFEMQRHEKGVYRTRVEGNLENSSYHYLVYVNGKINRTIDPYGLSSLANSRASAVINLEKLEKIKKYDLKNLDNYTDAIIYEISIRDITSKFESGGFFESLIEEKSYKNMPVGLDYIKQLGISHLQLMPVFDFETVDENNPKRLYNWGYDPIHYFSLEGSYSKNPNDPYDRMNSFIKLINAIHKRGLRVNLDVVFNHVYDMSLNSLNLCVPYYYFRYTSNNSLSNGSYCGNDLDSLRLMTRKLILDSLKNAINLYDVDGFRFDLMGIIDVDTMNEVSKVTRSIKKDIMLYGEGWNMPTHLDNSLKSTIENNYKLPNIAHFNDYFRDSLKGKTSDSERYDRGYLTGQYSMVYEMASSLVANSVNQTYFMRFISPNHSLNYVESHDNLTLWDKIKEACQDEDKTIKIKRQKLINAAVLFAQGIPFIHSGQEFCRTKLLHSNTYNSKDNINFFDWDRVIRYHDVVAYFKDCVKVRNMFKSFRLATSKEIEEGVDFKVYDNVILEYNIKSIDERIKEFKIIFNPTEYSRTYFFDKEYDIILDNRGYRNQTIKTSSIYVDSYSLVVCILKGQ